MGCSPSVWQVIASRPNVCKQLHMPAQSGSSAVLERMRRGYTREAYDGLVAHVREVIPAVALSTDIISGRLAGVSGRQGRVLRLSGGSGSFGGGPGGKECGLLRLAADMLAYSQLGRPTASTDKAQSYLPPLVG